MSLFVWFQFECFSKTIIFRILYQVKMRVDVDRSLQQRLGLAVELQASMEPDLFFLTEEGSKVPAHRSVQSSMVVIVDR